MRHHLSARALRFRLEFGRPYVRRAPRPLSALKNGADSEEKHQPARDIDTVAVDSLKALDPNGRLERSAGLIRHYGCRSRAETSGADIVRLNKARSHSAGLGRLRFLHQLKLVRHSGELA
jgi:hypothetical protein